MPTWREIVASSLDWEQARATLDHALDGLPAELRGKRANGFPHSVWELVEHIRLANHDLLAFMTAREYEDPKWPDDYWPSSPAPKNDGEWNRSVDEIHRETAALKALTLDESRDLTQTIPRGTGQTYLRTVLVAVDHTSYHVGQIVAVRRVLGAWPSS